MTYSQEDLKKLPDKPGVYIMRGRQGVVLYIGKAINIRTRVRQYFAPGYDLRPMIPLLVSKIESIETIVVSSEKEAFLLENNLIKQHKPKYNVLLKDDKSYIALKINNKDQWPRLQLVRYRGKPKADGMYFGPYTSAIAARNTLDLLQKIFPMRQCSDQELKRRTRPCILYDMHRCVAPCVGYCTKEEYDGYVQGSIRFLKGYDKEVLKDLHKQMDAAAEKLEFEKAADLYRTIQQIEKTVEDQRVDKPLGTDTDAIGLYREGEDVALAQLIFRGGKLSGSRSYSFNNVIENDDELLQSFLLQHYEGSQDLPKEIVVPVALIDSPTIEELLNVQIHTPQRGDKKAIIKMAEDNAESNFKRERDETAIREKTLLEMEEKFHLAHFPEKIECFDNSNIAGSYLVSSMVTFVNGQKDTSGYRKFKIRTVDAPDDYGAMREVLTRRYKRAKEENNLPNLIVIDGGKGHLNVAISILEELDIAVCDVIGVAKEDGRHDKGITSEQVFLRNVKDPIILPRHSRILFLLQQIRDEAHRSAIGYHRKLRSKQTIKSSLDDVPGIGPAKKKLLLKTFGSVKGLCEATDEQILGVKGISNANLAEIRKKFNG